MKRLFLSTYGCQMNVHDSERMLGLMEADGFTAAASAEEADVVVINTCAVREKPERKLLAELGNLKKMKKARPGMIIGVSGCMAPRDGELIRTKAPHVDLLIGPRSINRLPILVRQVELQRRSASIGRPLAVVEAVDIYDDPTPITPVKRASTISAWVDVMFGCSYACTFCAVPSARGPEISRPPVDILAEIAELAQLGYKEVTLLGQTVNAYGRDKFYRMPLSPSLQKATSARERIDFAWLLRRIDERAPGLRIRFTSPHPQLFNDRLIAAIADLGTVCEHVHLPLQSGDNAILRDMKRAYNYGQFKRIVEKLRLVIPEVAITTDIIVGFPGESDAHFHSTLRAVEELQFDQAFMFIYSPRHDTAAFGLPGQVPKETATERMNELVSKANDLFRQKNIDQIGKRFEVLVEGRSEKDKNRLTGRTRANKTMVFEGSVDLIGKLVDVEATNGFMWGFEGKRRTINEERITENNSGK
jgi:tRNA-2-methylthio-N6-dimethylallyladenosine synthase